MTDNTESYENKPFLSEEDVIKELSITAYNKNDTIWSVESYRIFEMAEKANAKIASLQDTVENLRSLLINAEQRGEDKANARINDERQKLKSKVEQLEKERDEFAVDFIEWLDCAFITRDQITKLLEQFKASKQSNPQ